ncbi:Crp/Fnr family transcriptional regulator [uncultured Erythrobacter sp.]|uniref:Crp/Fnr family transcriptional regulator n=1 Tax=uncultured Erythrobacter sp. TaxID=263913 RepID=UPI00261322FD|nr:Crp/Fnr family transcriptional regulator [uncultured Erythrobacter sp.]
MELADRTEALFRLLDCERASATALAHAMRPCEYTPRTILSHQGDHDDRLWLILEGTVQLQAISSEGQSTVISAFGPGELVGAFAAAEENAFDARALGRVQALQVTAIELDRLFQECPDLAAGMSRIYSGQLHTVLDRLAARVTLSAVGRCYRELLALAGPSDLISPPPVIAALALTAQTTRETGSRAISTLERRGIIERSSDRLEIVSRRMLEDLVV